MAKNKLYGFEEDPRLKIATKESKIIWGFALIGPAIQVVAAEMFGRTKGQDQLTWGNFPVWIWLSFFIIPLISITVMIIYVNTKFKNFSLDPYLDKATLDAIDKEAN